MILTDTAVVQGARITRDGYLVADALVARANNIQAYRAGELGLTDRAADETVRIFRPEAEVFAADALASAAHRPITLGHPPVMVDAKNWKQYSKGDMGGEIVRDGEFVRVPIKMMDAEAVDSVQRDHREFSLGYTAKLTMTPGVFDGQAYDGSMSQIRYNHLAACKTARGGPELRIVDERPADAPKKETPTMKTITFDGLQVADVSPAAEAVIIKLQGQVKDSTTAKDAADIKLAELTTTVATRDAEIVTLKAAVEAAKVTPAALRDAAKAYAKTLADAKVLAPTLTIADDADEAMIKKAVVSARVGDAAKDWTPAQIDAAFAIAAADIKDDADQKADPLRDVIKDGVKQPAISTSAYDAMVAETRDRWQDPKAA